jgi:osmotically-inducible protein OsmY
MVALQQAALPAMHSFAPCRDRESILAERAGQRLRSNQYLALKNITCAVEQGALVLRGQLPTYYLKQIASAAVADLDGIGQVFNLIEVVSLPRG